MFNVTVRYGKSEFAGADEKIFDVSYETISEAIESYESFIFNLVNASASYNLFGGQGKRQFFEVNLGDDTEQVNLATRVFKF